MPYTVRKQKCKKSGGESGSYVLSYTDKKGKKHRACHSSKKKAKGQIAAIEMRRESVNEKLLKTIIREMIKEELEESNKLDRDNDGDQDFDDVRIARMMAGGMSKEKATAKVKKRPLGDT
jgi:hypothetical protein